MGETREHRLKARDRKTAARGLAQTAKQAEKKEAEAKARSERNRAEMASFPFPKEVEAKNAAVRFISHYSRITGLSYQTALRGADGSDAGPLVKRGLEILRAKM